MAERHPSHAPPPAGTGAAVGRVPLATLLAYSLPAVAMSAPFFFVQFFFLKFATDVLLLAPATIGAIFAVGRLWDASTTAWTLSGLFAGAPLVMMLAGALVLRRYALDEHEHARIQSRLLESRATRGS